MKLYFKSSNGNRRFLDNVNSKSEISNLIKDFLDEHGYHSYYTRMWYQAESKEWFFDVGSWSEYFILTGADENFYSDGGTERIK